MLFARGNAVAETSLTREQVLEGYRSLLGREPESEAVIGQQLSHFASERDFWRALVSSDEFRLRTRSADQVVMDAVDAAYWAPAMDVEHEVPAATMDVLVERIRRQWTVLGETNPHYSVLTSDEFRTENLNPGAVARFYQSGLGSAQLIEHFERRTGTEASRGVCLELGCGVGRVTRYLADRFDKVIAADISPGNLALCNAHMLDHGITNVETVQIRDISDIEALPGFDFLYSLIVLQHNSPPIQNAILNTLLSKIRPSGGALFQIPTGMPHYRFSAAEYLDSDGPEMEMHCLPMHVVLQQIRDNGLNIMDIAPDAFIGVLGSNTFYALKPARVD